MQKEKKNNRGSDREKNITKPTSALQQCRIEHTAEIRFELGRVTPIDPDPRNAKRKLKYIVTENTNNLSA